jgi:hypothetical protein
MPTAAHSRAGSWSLLEAALLVGALLALGLAAASVPDAVLGVTGAEGIRNHLLTGPPGFVLLSVWWFVHANGDPDPTFLPRRSSLLACGAVFPALGLIALALATGAGVPEMGIGDSAITGASLVLLGAGAVALAAKPHEPCA